MNTHSFLLHTRHKLIRFLTLIQLQYLLSAFLTLSLDSINRESETYRPEMQNFYLSTYATGSVCAVDATVYHQKFI